LRILHGFSCWFAQLEILVDHVFSTVHKGAEFSLFFGGITIIGYKNSRLLEI